MSSIRSAAVGPITLDPLLVERIWGADTLGPWYPQPEPGKPVGEVWLTAEQCTVAGSTATLAQLASQLAAQQPEALGNATGERFPLLIKVLYPREKLSIQVHPNDAQAQAALGQPRGKTECWYVLSAEPGAQVAVGFHEPMTTDEVRQSIDDGSIESRLRMLTVKAGDLVFVDPGTVHAIGPGIVVLETQQYSDVTYRLWDYGRRRELHVDAGMAVIRTDTQAGLVPPMAMHGFDRLVSCRYFTVDRFKLAAGEDVALGCAGRLQVLIALGDGCSLQREGAKPTPLSAGRATILPVEEAAHTLRTTQPVEVIRVLGPETLA